MIEIIIDNVSVDMFPDTKVSGNYQPIDFTSNNTFKLPYTNTFTLPMTDKNAAAVGFDKVKNEFNKKDIVGKVFVDGELLFFGIVFIDNAEFETLRETIDISIVDYISFILNQSKDKKLGTIFDNPKYAKYRYFMLGATESLKNELYEMAYVDTCGYMEDEKAPFGADFSFLSRGGDAVTLPIVFKVKSVLEALLSPYNVTFDDLMLPYDLRQHTVGVSFPTIPISAKPKVSVCSINNTANTIKGVTQPKGAIPQERQDLYDKFEGMMRIGGYANRIEGIDWLFDSGKITIPNVGGILEQKLVRSRIKGSIMLRPTNITISNSGTYGWKYSVAGVDNVQYIDKYEGDSLELWSYLVDKSGFPFTRYKIADLSVDEKGYLSLKSISDDYLYSKMLDFDVNEYYTVCNVIHSNKKFVFGKQASLFGETLKCVEENVDPRIIFFTGSINVEYSVEYDLKDRERLYEFAYSSLTSSELPNYVEGVHADLSGQLAGKDTGRIIDMKETLNYQDTTVYDFLMDFFMRFNNKITSDGSKVFISPLQGSDIYSIDTTIDLSKYVDSQLQSKPSDTDSELKSFQISNQRLGLFQDRFFDGGTFGNSDLIILNKEKKNEKKVQLKSSIITYIAGGERVVSVSDSVADLLYKYNSTPMLGIGNYEKASWGDYGIRYGYFTSQAKTVPLMQCSLVSGNIGYPDLDVAYYPLHGVFLNTFTDKFRDADIYGTLTMTEYRNGRTVGDCEYKITGGVLFVHSFRFSTDPSTITDIEMLIPQELRDAGVPVRPEGCLLFETRKQNTGVFWNIRCGHNNVDKFNIDNHTRKLEYYNIVSIPLGIGAASGRVTPVAVFDSNFLTRKVELSVSLTKFDPHVDRDDTIVDTLSFSEKGIQSDKTISTAYDKYFKDYEDAILSPKGTTTEFEVYLSQEDVRKVIRGANFKLYDDTYSLVESSDLSFNREGSISKIKIAKKKKK